MEPTIILDLLEEWLPPVTTHVLGSHTPQQLLDLMEARHTAIQDVLETIDVALGPPGPHTVKSQRDLYNIANQKYRAENHKRLRVDPTHTHQAGLVRRANPGGVIKIAQDDQNEVWDGRSVLELRFNLKQRVGSDIISTQQPMIELLTRDELRRSHLYLDQKVHVQGRWIARPPCMKGKSGGGYVGCALYQLRQHLGAREEGTLGVYLNKVELQVFRDTGVLPADTGLRPCALCLLQDYTTRVGVNNLAGVGPGQQHLLASQVLQISVDTLMGYQKCFCLVPPFTAAPIMAFRPNDLWVDTDRVSGEHFVNDSTLYYQLPPVPSGFRSGVTC